MKAETPHWFVADNGQRLVAATGADRLVTTIKKAFACVSVPGSIKQNPLEGSNMLLLSVSPKDSQEWFVHRKVRHIPGGYIWGFPGGQKLPFVLPTGRKPADPRRPTTARRLPG